MGKQITTFQMASDFVYGHIGPDFTVHEYDFRNIIERHKWDEFVTNIIEMGNTKASDLLKYNKRIGSAEVNFINSLAASSKAKIPTAKPEFDSSFEYGIDKEKIKEIRDNSFSLEEYEEKLLEEHNKKPIAGIRGDVSNELNKDRYKYNEAETLKEISEYINSTYDQHYVGNDNVQAFDLIKASGHSESFCIGNAIKYLSRYGKKDGRNRKDLLKAIHYIILNMGVNKV